MGEKRSCQKGNWITWKTKDSWHNWIVYIKSYEGYIKISCITENKWRKEDFWEEGRYDFKMDVASWETEWVRAN